MPDHPNLIPAINRAIAQSDRDGGVFTKDVLPGGSVLVQTLNTLYTLVNHGDRWMAQGGDRLPEMTIVHVNGSTFGGSMIQVGFIGIAMRLELGVPKDKFRGGPILHMTPTQTIAVRLPDDAPVYASLAQIIFDNTDTGAAKQFVMAIAYGATAQQLVARTGLEPKRVSEIVALLRFLELPCTWCMSRPRRDGSLFCQAEQGREDCESEALLQRADQGKTEKD